MLAIRDAERGFIRHLWYAVSNHLSREKRRNIVSTSRCPVLLAQDLSGSSILPFFRRCGGGERKSRGGCGISSLRQSRFGTPVARPVLRIAAYPVRPVEDTPRAIQVFAHQHVTLGQRVSPFGLFDLQRAVGDAHGVVLVHHALLLYRKNAL